MPRYRVTSPDGVTYMVDAPDGMSDEQVIAYARQPHSFTGPATSVDKNAVESLPFGSKLPVNPLTIGLGATLVGAGRTGSKIEEGNKQLADLLKFGVKNAVGGNADQEFANLQAQQQTQKQNDAAYAPLRQQHPFFTGAGETLPAVGVPVGQASAFARVAAPALGLGAIGSAQYGSPQQRTVNGITGAVVGGTGGAAGELLNMAVSPATSMLSNAQQQAAKAASDKLGINLLPSQLTGNPTLSRVEDMLSRVQGGAGVMGEFRANNQRQLNKAASSSMGDNSDSLTKDVLAANKARIGSDREALRQQVTMPVTQPIFDAVSQAEQLLSRGLKNVDGKSEALSTLSDLKDRLYNSKQLTGDEYQAIITDLGSAKRSTNNQTIAGAYDMVKRAMDKEAQGSNGAAWAQNSKEYASFKTLMQPGAVNEVTGDAMPGGISRAVDRQFKEANKTGKVDGPLVDIGNFYKSVPQSRAGSPTFERQAASNLMDWMLSPAYYLAAKGLTSKGVGGYLGGGALGNPEMSAAAGRIGSRAALPLAASPMEQALFNMGLLGYGQ